VKRFIASGFGVGIAWNFLFGDKKGGGTAASLLFTLIIYFIQLNVLELSILFIVLVLIYILTVDDQDADDDPSWITLDEIVGMSLVSVASPSRLLPLIAGFIVFRLSDIMKQPRFVKDLENYPGKLGVLYDDLGAGLMGLLSGTIVNQIITLTL
jgi:phosphatidylglycerophosphatase A